MFSATTAASSASNNDRSGADGVIVKLSPLAGTPVTVNAMPSIWIAWPETYGTLVSAVAAPLRSTV